MSMWLVCDWFCITSSFAVGRQCFVISTIFLPVTSSASVHFLRIHAMYFIVFHFGTSIGMSIVWTVASFSIARSVSRTICTVSRSFPFWWMILIVTTLWHINMPTWSFTFVVTLLMVERISSIVVIVDLMIGCWTRGEWIWLRALLLFAVSSSFSRWFDFYWRRQIVILNFLRWFEWQIGHRLCWLCRTMLWLPVDSSKTYVIVPIEITFNRALVIGSISLRIRMHLATLTCSADPQFDCSFVRFPLWLSSSNSRCSLPMWPFLRRDSEFVHSTS